MGMPNKRLEADAQKDARGSSASRSACTPSRDDRKAAVIAFVKEKRDAQQAALVWNHRGTNVRAVTAYYPDPEEWEPDLRTRRTLK
jgi:hypothetical protein